MQKLKLRRSELHRRDANRTQLLVFLVTVILLMLVLQPKVFFTKSYLVSMLKSSPEYSFIAMGMMICIMAGGINLALVASANLSAIISCKLFMALLPGDGMSAFAEILILLAIVLVTLLIGFLSGIVPGYLIASLNVPPMVATLASMNLFLGMSVALTRGSTLTGIPTVISKYLNRTILNDMVPIAFLLFVIFAVLLALLLKKTSFGFSLTMLGSNQTSAIFSGINVKRHLVLTYMTAGLLSAFSGIIMASRFNSILPRTGDSYIAQSILICLLAGVDPNGGFGEVSNLALAIFILQVLSSGFNIFPTIDNFIRNLIWGGVLILVLCLNRIRSIRRNKATRRQTEKV